MLRTIKPTLLLSVILVLSARSADYPFNWATKTDRDGRIAGYYSATPIPVTEALSSYSITNDEGTKTLTLGTVYFVDGTLSGTTATYNPATRAATGGSYTAYKTIGGSAVVGAGNNTILVRSGTYKENALYLPAGTDSTHRYSVIGYNNERPIVDGTGGGAGDPIMQVSYYGTVQRLEFTNSTDASLRMASTNSYFIDLYVHDVQAAFGNAAIHLAGNTNAWINHCTISRTKNHGIKVSDATCYSIVEWTEVEWTAWWSPEGDEHGDSYHPTPIDLVSHNPLIGVSNTVRYCSIRNACVYGLGVAGQQGYSVHHNEVYNTFLVYNGYVGGYANAATYIQNALIGAHATYLNEDACGSFYSNVIHDKNGAVDGVNLSSLFCIGNSTDAAVSKSPNYIYNNFLYQTDASSLNYAVYVFNIAAGHDLRFLNNTLVADTAGTGDTILEVLYTGSVGITNNIVYQKGAGAAWGLQTGNVHNNNCVYYPSGTVGHTLDATDISADPLLVSASSFQIQSTSPCKDAGATLVGFSADINGTSRPWGAAWDIGAYEYSALTISSSLRGNGILTGSGRIGN